jgi:hypothetical protein
MLFHFFTWISEHPERADNGVSKIDPGSRMDHSTVMLSAAKHLGARGDRPFAAAQGDSVGAD